MFGVGGLAPMLWLLDRFRFFTNAGLSVFLPSFLLECGAEGARTCLASCSARAFPTVSGSVPLSWPQNSRAEVVNLSPLKLGKSLGGCPGVVVLAAWS